MGQEVQARHLIIGTAGHVDHGKTTLIRALTGTDTDRLAEEKARGMTIDLGFAFLSLPGEPPIEAGIVDVPGHERFVKNMLAGAGGIDVALVVVAADEGPMPQTREHLDILTLLGVAHGVIALTRADLADPDLREMTIEATRSALASTSLKEAPLVVVSAETGEGLDDLGAALAAVCAAVPARDSHAPVCLPIDRVFSLPGVGTVVTGTLVRGTLRVGDALEIQPQALLTRARSLQTHNAKLDEALPGMRVAVNLPGIEVAQLERGAVLAAPGTLSATRLFDATITVLPEAPRSLRHWERVRLHLGTGEVLARLLLLEGTEAKPGSVGVPAQVLCETDAVPIRGERFVIRTYSPSRAVGGGVVVERHPTRRYRRGDASALAVFAARGADNQRETVYTTLASRHADFSPEEVATATNLPVEDATDVLETLVSEGRVFVLPYGRYLSDAAVVRLRETARRVLGAFHRQNPLRQTMPREGLRLPLTKAVVYQDFMAVVAFLVQTGELIADGPRGGVRLPTHEVVLPANWQKPAAEMLAVYRAAGLTPPSPGNFQANYPRDVRVEAILVVLAERGELVKIADGLYLSAETVQKVKNEVRGLANSPGGITVATVRDATGSSRKMVLPLLEYLDAHRFTRRVGDARELVS